MSDADTLMTDMMRFDPLTVRRANGIWLADGCEGGAWFGGAGDSFEEACKNLLEAADCGAGKKET